ncbi:hypothetical protein HNR42_001114 [Deinobacterium chartae]|uniref:DUF2071 domain-containing protein n=1 Tax=Deinobacterium chartae TaxID=521158 RepID=A0A841HWC7_9DEIO|nr:hypothetical protein [Deinobacterium chartae]
MRPLSPQAAALRPLQLYDHRPWPLPKAPWVMWMSWQDLLFLHWPVPPETLRPHLPGGLELDTFDGQAWLGAVPFRMADVRPRGIPPLPGLSYFPELNLRTYVRVPGETHGGKPGVWFFSLDAANPLAVRGARSSFHLPYFDARMQVLRQGAAVDYTSRRTHRRAPPAEFRARYRPSGPVYLAQPGSLEAWLTERYCLYSAQGERLWRGHIHHARWPLQPAEVTLEANTLAEGWGLHLPGAPALAHFARRIDMVAWTLERVR